MQLLDDIHVVEVAKSFKIINKHFVISVALKRFKPDLCIFKVGTVLFYSDDLIFRDQ